MSTSRYRNNFRANYLSANARRLKAMLSRRIRGQLRDNEAVEMIGREAADGSYEADTGDRFAPVGLIARAAADAAVESLCAFIGADGDHPVEVNTLDWGRQVVINAVKLQADETIVYSQKTVLKITADGDILIGRVNADWTGFTDFDSVVLKSEFDAHRHQLPALVGQTTYDPTLPRKGPDTSEPEAASETILKVQKP